MEKRPPEKTASNSQDVIPASGFSSIWDAVCHVSMFGRLVVGGRLYGRSSPHGRTKDFLSVSRQTDGRASEESRGLRFRRRIRLVSGSGDRGSWPLARRPMKWRHRSLSIGHWKPGARRIDSSDAIDSRKSQCISGEHEVSILSQLAKAVLMNRRTHHDTVPGWHDACW